MAVNAFAFLLNKIREVGFAQSTNTCNLLDRRTDEAQNIKSKFNFSNRLHRLLSMTSSINLPIKLPSTWIDKESYETNEQTAISKTKTNNTP